MPERDWAWEISEWRMLHLELGDYRVPYDPSEWGGRGRAEAYEEIHADLLLKIDSAKLLGLDVSPWLRDGERRFEERWPEFAD